MNGCQRSAEDEKGISAVVELTPDKVLRDRNALSSSLLETKNPSKMEGCYIKMKYPGSKEPFYN